MRLCQPLTGIDCSVMAAAPARRGPSQCASRGRCARQGVAACSARAVTRRPMTGGCPSPRHHRATVLLASLTCQHFRGCCTFLSAIFTNVELAWVSWPIADVFIAEPMADVFIAEPLAQIY